MGRFRRTWVAAFIGVAVIVALLAARAIAQVPTVSSGQSADTHCSPQPCAAPNGFEVDVNGVSAQENVVLIQVSFKNRTQKDPFEAVSYRHTSPADFLLKMPSGSSLRPVFNGSCSDWGEIRVERNAAAGPEKLCFATEAAGFDGTQLVWDPDLGLIPHPVAIPLRLGATTATQRFVIDFV